jgi:hypothetical protein
LSYWSRHAFDDRQSILFQLLFVTQTTYPMKSAITFVTSLGRLVSTGCLLTGALIALAASDLAAAAIYYVAPWGSDSGGNGSLASPWFTLNKATYTMNGGDTVQMRGGTYYYTQAQIVFNGGPSNTARTIIKKYGTEIPVLDFSGTPYYSGWSQALDVSVNNLTISGLTLQNSYYLNGIRGTGSNVTIQSCTVKNFQYGAITLLSSTYSSSNAKIDNIQLLNCTVTDCWQANNPGAIAPFVYDPQYRQAGGGWGFTLGFANVSSGTISGCNVQKNYGEGIDMLRCEGANLKISNNTAKDNFSVNIYVDNVRGANGVWASVSGNKMSNTNGASYANYKLNGYNGIGIALATEPYGSLTINSAYINVTSNTATNCSDGFSFGTVVNSIISYLSVDGNAAIGCNVIGYKNNPSNWSVTWGTNKVGTVATTGSIPLGK